MEKSDIRILIVDDDSESRYIFPYVLSKMGYSQVDSIDGRGAKERIDDYTPNLILIDPKIHPLVKPSDICSYANKSATILFMSTDTESQFKTTYSQYGAKGFFDKSLFLKEGKKDLDNIILNTMDLAL